MTDLREIPKTYREGELVYVPTDEQLNGAQVWMECEVVDSTKKGDDLYLVLLNNNELFAYNALDVVPEEQFEQEAAERRTAPHNIFVWVLTRDTADAEQVALFDHYESVFDQMVSTIIEDVASAGRLEDPALKIRIEERTVHTLEYEPLQQVKFYLLRAEEGREPVVHAVYVATEAVIRST